MINLPVKAEVYCSDGPAGRSTYVIGNPMKKEVTHLVVKSYLPPFHEYLVPVDQVEETTNERINLKCTRHDLNRMEPFEYKEDYHTEVPGYLYVPYIVPGAGFIYDDLDPTVPVKRRNISSEELALCRDARIEATDGYVGQVGELLIDSNSMKITHLVVLVGHLFKEKKITIPVSQIDHIDGETIHLNMDRQGIQKFSATPGPD